MAPDGVKTGSMFPEGGDGSGDSSPEGVSGVDVFPEGVDGSGDSSPEGFSGVDVFPEGVDGSGDSSPEGLSGVDVFPDGVEGSSHAVSEPDASSPASFVFPAGHATHDLDDTCSFEAQSLAEHVAEVKVPSEHDDASEAKYPASHVGVHKSPERIVSAHVPTSPFDGGVTLHDSARVNSSSLFSVV